VIARLRRVAPSTWLSLDLVVLGTALSLLLRHQLPLNPDSYEHGYFDDALFPKLAASIVRGDWLGHFDKMTLAKGSAYPAFIAITHKLGLPLLMAQHAAYLVAAGVCAVAVGLATKRVAFGALVYLVLAFDPTLFNASATTVAREFLATPAALFAVSAFFIAVYGVLHWRRAWIGLLVAPVVGLAAGVLALTREETVWVAPSFAVIALALLTARLWRSWDRRTCARAFGGVALVACIVAVTFEAPIQLVKQRNARFYGVRITSDLSTGEFARAYAAMTRVRGVPLRPFVPINREQREQIYAVSAAAAVLRPVLESPDNGWKKWECPDYGPCDDYPGGGEPWAFRDAAVATGHFDNEAEFQRLFGRIADDVEGACASRRLQCSRALPASVQMVQRARLRPVASRAVRRFATLVGPFAADPSLDVDSLYDVPARERRELAEQILVGVPATQKDAVRKLRAVSTAPLTALRVLYGWLLVPLLLVSAAAFAVVGWRDRRLRPAIVLALALAVGAASRLVVFAIVETTQNWISPHARYDLPTRAFLLSCAAIGLGLVPDLRRQWRTGRVLDTGDRLDAEREAHHHEL
jgi:hypothetical protein